jgi:D-sedoheptulose 7-phosphate isomerase
MRHEGLMPSSLNLADVFTDGVREHLAIIRQLDAQQDAFEQAAILITDSLSRGNKVIWCGNGGSAGDAQHLAAELVGHFRRPRSPLASVALTTNTSLLTAIANDFSFNEVFERQIDAMCQPGDVVVGISTSGNSRNVCAALRRARELEASTIALTGKTGGRLAGFADICIRVPSTNPARIQEVHILCGHMLCEWIEAATYINHALAVNGGSL